MKRVSITRLQKVTREEFARLHLHGVGLPAIITDVAEDWPALGKWSFEYFREKYGGDFLPFSLGLASKAAKFTRFAQFLDYVAEPSRPLAGFWVDAKMRPLREAPVVGQARHYLVDWFAFKKHPELREDIIAPPYFMSDFESSLSPELREALEVAFDHKYSSIFVGPEGTVFRLHHDYGHTYTALTQICGRKRALLFSPDESEFLYDGKVDPEQPDLSRFSDFAKATGHGCVLEPGETLFIPPDWWHWVKALDPSITMSHCYFNELNVIPHLKCVLHKPELAAAMAANPDWWQALGVDWLDGELHLAGQRGDA